MNTIDVTAKERMVTYPLVLFWTVASGPLETTRRVFPRAAPAGRLLQIHLSE